MRFKILMLTEYFSPYDRGGAEWSTFHLAKALQKRGYEIGIFTPNYGVLRIKEETGVKVYRFPYYLKLKNPSAAVSPFHHTHFFWWVWTTFCLIRRVFIMRPSILHVQGKYFLPQAVIVGKLFKIPVVAALRDYIVLCPLGYCIRRERSYQACNLRALFSIDLRQYVKIFKIRGWLNYLVVLVGSIYGWLVSLWLRLFLHHADQIVAISQKLKQIYEVNHIPVNIIIYNSFTPPQPLKKYQNDKYLLYVGRLTEGKGFTLLLQAYESFAESAAPKLLVIGDGIGKDILAKRVEYLGQKNYSDTLGYIVRAELVIVPSVWEEPFGRVALEALLLGSPVVCTNRGGLPEIVQNNITGIVVEPEPKALVDGIRQALKNEKKLRGNILKLKPQLWWKFVDGPVREYEKLYQSLL